MAVPPTRVVPPEADGFPASLLDRCRTSDTTAAGTRAEGEWFASNAALLRVPLDLEGQAVEGQVWCGADGAWRVRGSFGEAQLHSRRPHEEAEQLIDLAMGPEVVPWLVVHGLGLGFLLDALDRRGWSGRVLAFEPNPDVARAWLGRRDWRSWLASDRLGVLVGPSFDGASTYRALAGDGAVEPRWIVSPVADRSCPGARAQAEAVVARLRFDARANLSARREHGARYVLNTLRNAARIQSSADVAQLDDLAVGCPAIVVGAGPSLDASLAALRALRARALVVAVDTALRPLLEAGVEPHLVVAVDPGEANARHLVELPSAPRTFLVAEGSLDPTALQTFTDRLFTFAVADHEPWPWLRRHGVARGRLRAWGSVLTCAYDLACRMGCDPVVFAGSDLAFTGGRPYARGITYEEDWRRLEDWGVPLSEQWRQQVARWSPAERPALSGGVAPTAPHLIAFRDWLVEDAARQHGRRVVNATGGGILEGASVPVASMAVEAREWKARADLDARIQHAARPARVQEGSILEAIWEACREEGDDLQRWTAFAPGLTRERIANVVALARRAEREPSPSAPRAVGVVPAWDEEWMTPLARAVHLVPFEVPAWRMERVSATVRRFRPRTTAGRLASCTLRIEGPVVAEDGVGLDWGGPVDFAHSGWERGFSAGQYFIWRDEVYFTSRDGTDPRDNGRRYTVLMPSFVAYLEGQTPAETERLRL